MLPQQVAQEYNMVAPETHFPLIPSCRSKYMETISQHDFQDDNWISHRDSKQTPCRTLDASMASGSRSTEIPVVSRSHYSSQRAASNVLLSSQNCTALHLLYPSLNLAVM